MKLLRSTVVVALLASGSLGLVVTPAGATSGRVSAVTAPGAPTGVTGEAQNTRVMLSWTAPVDDGGQAITTYHVQYSDDGGTTWNDSPDAATSPTTVKNLVNGDSYEFQVDADNGTDVGPWAQSAEVIPHGPVDSTSIAATPDQTIKYGGTATLTTTLTDTTTSSPLANMTVDLLERPANSTQYKQIGTAQTDDNGHAQLSESPTITTAYKWTFAGTLTHHLANSFDGTVLVTLIVKAHITKSSVKHGKPVKIWGKLKPGGKSVELQELTGGAFTTLPITARVKDQKLPNGKKQKGFILPYTPKKKGSETLRVIADDDSLNAGNTSKSLSLTVT